MDVKHWLWTTSVAAIVASCSAFAADLGGAPPSAFAWSGCYVGLHAGGDFGRSNWSLPSGFGPVAMGISGAIGGAQAGCNYQTQNFVIGGEAEIWGSGLKGSTSQTYGGVATDTFATRSDFAGGLALRGGYAIDRTLIFGKVGVAIAQYQYVLNYEFTGATATAEATHTGLSLGLGVEYALDMHWSVKGEYDFIDWGDGSATLSGTNAPTFGASFKNTENIVEAGVNYRF